MDDENGLVWVNEKNNLYKPPTHASPNDEPLVLIDSSRKRLLGMSHNDFRRLGIDAMLGNMVTVPVDSAELHGPIQG